jgi:hypothetical protein
MSPINVAPMTTAVPLRPIPARRATRHLVSWAPYAAGAALLAVMLLLSPQFGYTWDERVQQWYGEQIWGYLNGTVPASLFETSLGIQDVNIQFLYSGLVEVTAVAVQRLSNLDTYVARHAVDAVFGWLGIVWCGMLAARLCGRRAGWLAAVLLVLSPRYLGDAMNNSKDVPFATFMLIALYYLLTVSRTPPFLTWGHAVKLAVAIALAISVRPIGLLLVVYAGGLLVVLTGSAWWRGQSTEPRGGSPELSPRRRPGLWPAVLGGGARLLAAAVVAIPLGTLFWPWGQVSPFVRPVEAFLALSGGLRTTSGYPVLYGGQDISAGTLPWHYLPVWLAISTPPVVLTGLLFLPLLWRRAGGSRPALIGLGTFVLAPIAAAVIRRPNMYDGMRQLLFLFPPLVVLSAGAWLAAVEMARGGTRTAAVAVLVVGLIEPLLFQVRNHPNQIVYFSPLIGGPRAAFGQFDMDYWGNSMLQAVQWSRTLAEQSGMPIVVSGNPWEAVFADSSRYRQLAFARRESNEYHLDIRLLRGPSASVKYFAERPDVVHIVRAADGTPLTVVIQGPAYAQLQRQIELRGRSGLPGPPSSR